MLSACRSIESDLAISPCTLPTDAENESRFSRSRETARHSFPIGGNMGTRGRWGREYWDSFRMLSLYIQRKTTQHLLCIIFTAGMDFAQ